MRKLDRLVVVGASLAGLRAAQTLRDEGYTGDLTLVGAEPHLPYNRPPLSKSLLTGDDDVALPGSDQLDARWLIGRNAVGLDTARQAITLDDGAQVPYDGLVITTGARPRRLDDSDMSLTGVHLLRTFDDAMNLRKALREGPRRVAVIGGGIIGGEVSSTLRALGIEVVLIDAAPAPMAGPLGETVGEWLAEHHTRNGVELVSGVRVESLKGDGHVSAVRLSDGRSLPADLVIVGLGVLPNTEWLDGSGLHLDDGVLTDSALFARGHANIVAAGDVARWPHGVFDDEYVRIEHWANANEQAPSPPATSSAARRTPSRSPRCIPWAHACTAPASSGPAFPEPPTRWWRSQVPLKRRSSPSASDEAGSSSRRRGQLAQGTHQTAPRHRRTSTAGHCNRGLTHTLPLGRSAPPGAPAVGIPAI
ncbi:hypothetical protein BJF79_19645 [Actinomadura sp. CNU-125]|uniref:NAD(P)/FAD-dependent oxidoreductase n=1 Tax=Actinomadura sp. CNU-125 TaxID=1904961 RepID=UPI0009658620|nr:NAD(P)/FAD-dependent oxidoreductase [Actinomadura sp. CNU-125]OLT13898.1 hypothetical protein BJF79_19645 [Actinomadura sp. CNU-125]